MRTNSSLTGNGHGSAQLVRSSLRVLRETLGLVQPPESLDALSHWRRHYAIAPHE